MKHTGGSQTKGGFYWKKGEWEIITVEGKSGTLPGTSAARYLRIPGLLLLPVGLVLSLVYVIFLPVVGFAMLFHTLFAKLSRSLAREPATVHAGEEARTERR